MQTRARIKDKTVIFSSPMAAWKFWEIAEGKEVIIAIDDKPTSNMRRYFEGAVVPSYYFQNPFSGWENFKDCREALKLAFLPSYTKSLSGKRVLYSRSTTDLSKERFTRFLDDLTRDMMEQGFEVPDPDDYKAWRDSAPAAGEVYPPLLRLKNLYVAAQLKDGKGRKRKTTARKRNPKRNS